MTKLLGQLINYSLSSKFPLMCITTKVKPLYKKGKNTEPKIIATPVSLLPTSFSTIERFVYNQLIKKLEKHDVPYECKSGFEANTQ